MSKPVPQKKTIPKPAKKKAPASRWDRLEAFLAKRETSLAILLFLVFTFFGFVLFDVRISTGGDDATYIERGFNLVKHGEISFYQGPLYPAILGIGIAIFGINLVALKSMSFLFMLLQVIFLFLALRRRMPYAVVFLSLFFVSTCYFIQYYSSQTYTEAAFMFLQALTLYFIFKLLDAEPQDTTWKSNMRLWITVGFLMLMLSLCKSIAIVCFLPLIFYFLLKRKWIMAGKAFTAFLFWKIIYEVGMRIFYRAPDIGQVKQILLKDLYHPDQGYETLTGLVTRFFQNANTYFSLNLLRFLSIQDPFSQTSSPLFASLVGILLITCTVYLFRKNNFLFFIALYTLILYGGIFVGIQASNRQARLIIIALPLTYLIFLGAGYYASRNFAKWGVAIVISVVVVLFMQLKNTLMISNDHLPLLKKNLKGDLYYGYTPDWVNYLKLSRWCADHLPDSSLVACRKGSMSFIYGRGKHFYEINQAPTKPDADSVLAQLKRAGVTHVIIAKLRSNETVNDGVIINTVHRLFVPVIEKYPDKVKYLFTLGKEEEASLYEIDY